MFCVDDSGARGEVPVVDKARLKKSIMSCSFVVFTGTGGSDTTNALLSEGSASLAPTNVFCDVAECVLECLLASCANSSSSSSSSAAAFITTVEGAAGTTVEGAEGTTVEGTEGTAGGGELNLLPSSPVRLELGTSVN